MTITEPAATPADDAPAMDRGWSRRMWQVTEPYHAIAYFSPHVRAVMKELGLKGYWMGYFAARSAPLGQVPASVVEAAFYNFHPGLVHRALPDAWALATPDAVLSARRAALDVALRELLADLADGPQVEEAADLTRQAALACPVAGRPLFAAHTDVPWPDRPHLALWHATALLREFRGDGHVAALVTQALDGVEANVLASAAKDVPAQLLRETRGWSDDEWQAGADRLRARGLVDDAGRLTAAGRELDDRIEAMTDAAALPPWQHLGTDGCRRLVDAMTPLVARIDAAEQFPYPNPIGLPRLTPDH